MSNLGPALLVALLIQVPTVSTLVGDGTSGDSGDGGPAKSARLNQPFGVVYDAAGNLFVADTGNHRVRKIDAKTGVISTVAGAGRKGFSGDGGPARDALLNEPYGLAIDPAGNLYIADRLNHRIRSVGARSGTIRTIAGADPGPIPTGEAPAIGVPLLDAGGIALDGKGYRLFIADVAAHRVWSLDLTSGLMRPFAGDGRAKHDGDGGPALQASLQGPRAVAVAPDGKVVIVERNGNTIRTVDPRTLVITTIAGTGRKGYSGDGGPAREATFDGPKELAIDRDGDILVVDTENHAIRRIRASDGTISTVVGLGKPGGTGDGGPAREARLDRPHGVAVAPDGAIVIGDTNNHRVRKVSK